MANATFNSTDLSWYWDNNPITQAPLTISKERRHPHWHLTFESNAKYMSIYKVYGGMFGQLKYIRMYLKTLRYFGLVSSSAIILLMRTKGEGEVAVFSTKHWDCRNRADTIKSATPCHDTQVVGPYRGSNPLHLTVLTSKSEDYTTAPQHLLVYCVSGHKISLLLV